MPVGDENGICIQHRIYNTFRSITDEEIWDLTQGMHLNNQ